jgi:hypothetical protein
VRYLHRLQRVLTNLMISDLCRLAIGETLPEDKPL